MSTSYLLWVGTGNGGARHGRTLAARSAAASARPRSTSQGATRPDAGMPVFPSPSSSDSSLLVNALDLDFRPRLTPVGGALSPPVRGGGGGMPS